jgi:hypothetical protein
LLAKAESILRINVPKMLNNQVRGVTTGAGPVWGQLHGDVNTFMGKGRQHTATGLISWSDITMPNGAKGFEASVGGKGFGAAEIDIDTFTSPLFSDRTPEDGASTGGSSGNIMPVERGSMGDMSRLMDPDPWTVPVRIPASSTK